MRSDLVQKLRDMGEIERVIQGFNKSLYALSFMASKKKNQPSNTTIIRVDGSNKIINPSLLNHQWIESKIIMLEHTIVLRYIPQQNNKESTASPHTIKCNVFNKKRLVNNVVKFYFPISIHCHLFYVHKHHP
ncbi:hypothetical protein ACTFIR_007516 [Dictyostelium discoideum]